jgi:sporulation protein YlmC with PRC-barrel domain
MLREVKALHGSKIHALDGEIGRVDEILFDDEHWTVRYLVVETGSWLFGRKVLISPLAFGQLDLDHHTLNINLTREQIEKSPGVETDRPVSRQWEEDYYDYYSWPYYWGGMGGMGGWGPYWYPGALLAQPFTNVVAPQQRYDDQARNDDDVHLRSTKEVTGYKIAAIDGHLGHVQDFIFDDATWRICYFAVDTRDWWPGKKVLLPPNWIDEVNWPERSVTVDVTRDQVQNAPEWNPDEPISRAFEDQLYGYYARQRPQEREPIAV